MSVTQNSGASEEGTAPRSQRIFISYRREDTIECAHRLYKAMAPVFDKRNIFFDLDTIPGGVSFQEYINEQLPHYDVVVALIGPLWVGPKMNGGRRILDKGDFVRIEVATAMRLGIRVIPLYTGTTELLQKRNLPLDLRKLPGINAMRIDHKGRDFDVHVNRLIDTIKIPTVVEFTVTPSAPGSWPQGGVPAMELAPQAAPVHTESVSQPMELGVSRKVSGLGWWPLIGLCVGTVPQAVMWLRKGRFALDTDSEWLPLTIALPFAACLGILLRQRGQGAEHSWRYLRFSIALIVSTALGYTIMFKVIEGPWQLALAMPMNIFPAIVIALFTPAHRKKWWLPFMSYVAAWIGIGLAYVLKDNLLAHVSFNGWFPEFEAFERLILPLLHCAFFGVLAIWWSWRPDTGKVHLRS